MRSPFPGMDPYLEQPDLWPDVHTSLITIFRELLAGEVGPEYWIGVERRVLIETREGDAGATLRPDLSVHARTEPGGLRAAFPAPSAIAVRVALEEPFEEPYLVVKDVSRRRVVTVVELLSPTNKLPGAGRAEYLAKRGQLLESSTSLVEVDLLRGGRKMPLSGAVPEADYRASWFRGWERPHGWTLVWSIRDPLPVVPVPLQRGDGEVPLDLGRSLQLAYERNHYERLIDYTLLPDPPLTPPDQAWAQALRP